MIINLPNGGIYDSELSLNEQDPLAVEWAVDTINSNPREVVDSETCKNGQRPTLIRWVDSVNSLAVVERITYKHTGFHAAFLTVGKAVFSIIEI